MTAGAVPYSSAAWTSEAGRVSCTGASHIGRYENKQVLGRVSVRVLREVTPVDDGEFRRQARVWLTDNVDAALRGLGGPGREHEAFARRLDFNRKLAAAGWTCLGW